MPRQCTIVWVDVAGSAALRVIKTSTGIGPIETDMQSLSNAAILSCAEGILDFPGTLPVNADYPLLNTTAIITFADTLGSEARVYIPAPKESIFMADGETVDPTMIASLIADCIGNLVAGSGNTVDHYVSGYLTRSKVSGYASTS